MSSERQLHLFKSRRQRGVAAPPPLEFRTQCAVADSLRRWAVPGWRWTHLPLGEERPDAAGERLQRMGTQPGWTDFLLIAPRGHPEQRPHFLELKRRATRGALKGAQGDFEEWCELNGCPHAVATTYEEALHILKAWGALQARVHVQ